MTEPTWPTVMTPAHAALSTAAKAGSTLSKVWTKMVTTGMGIHTTPAPAALPSTTIEAWTRSPLPLVTVTKAADTGATLSEALTEMVTEGMGIPTTPAPAPLSTAADTGATLSEALTEMVTEGMGIPTTPAPASTAADTGATLSEALTEMVTEGMGIHTTPAPASTAANTGATLSEALTEMVTEDIDQDDGAFAALIAGIVCFTLLVICIIVWRWHLSRHKGSYVTNEMDDDDDMDDEESVGSNTALQSREPLETKEDA
ncbi:mucin-2 isoform X4 [Perca flavescens]|uniref:mucin-2 isoform X4 n=1 Tax=Perca flavescens TaxID=8167 RepID=UPI00106E42C3|nr:mucin-2-like isoform X4 [Perca flavescens]